MAVLRPGSLWFSLKPAPGSQSRAAPSRSAIQTGRNLALSVAVRRPREELPPGALDAPGPVGDAEVAADGTETPRLSAQLLRHALIERARMEAELEGRHQLAERRHAHELRLGEIRHRLESRRYRGLFVGSVGLVVVLVFSVGVLARQAHRASALAEQRDALLQLERQSRRHSARLLEMARHRETALRAELQQLKDRTAGAKNSPE